MKMSGLSRALCPLLCLAASLPAQNWIPAADSAVVRTGAWSIAEFRRASSNHLLTTQDGAALELAFTGTGIVLSFDAHGVPYAHLGLENLGSLEVTVDGRGRAAVLPQREDRDVVLARGLAEGAHTLRLVHRATAEGRGVRISGFRLLRGGEGDLAFLLHR